MDVSDVLALHALLARYGHLIDEREFDRLDEVFTDDVTYDASEFGVPVIHGLPELIAFMTAETRHPLAHHCTNVMIDPSGLPGPIGLLSKGIGVMHDGRVGSVTYVDLATFGPRGWRLQSRRAVLRR